MSYKKARARPLKSGPSMGLANTASKMKSLPSARDRSTQSSASSDEDSDSDDESSDEESVEADMLQELNDVSFTRIQSTRFRISLPATYPQANCV